MHAALLIQRWSALLQGRASNPANAPKDMENKLPAAGGGVDILVNFENQSLRLLSDLTVSIRC